MSHRALNGVIGNFLSTYTSRHSDYGGYWLFGFLVPAIDTLEIDLLAVPSDGEGPIGVATRLAQLRMGDQLRYARISPQVLRDARLTLQRRPEQVSRLAGCTRRSGYLVSITAAVTTTREWLYQREVVVFVAPHDPLLEGYAPRAT